MVACHLAVKLVGVKSEALVATGAGGLVMVVIMDELAEEPVAL